MGLIDKILRNREKINPDVSEQTYKHNIYTSEISQYSSLPRYYYIEGKKYDIDSPKSVASIPICKNAFNINDELWGIDAILREHVNRYYTNIPDELKSACYPKISEFEYSPYKTETNAEKSARKKQELEKQEHIKKIHEITKFDMQKFQISQYQMTDIVADNNMAIMTINKNNQAQVLKELAELNQKLPEAMRIAKIKTSFLIPLDEIEFNNIKKKSGRDTYTQYYTFFECTPYTKTGKNAKYPLILHYATKSLDSVEASTKFFGDIHYMQDGTIGKAKLINWIKNKCYIIQYGMVGATLSIKSVSTNDTNGGIITLYKA